MEALRQYIISVTAAALVCGSLQGLAGSGAMGKLLRLICGLFLAYTLLGPIADVDLEALGDVSLPTFGEATQAAEAGQRFSEESRRERITGQVQAYILDKAAQLGVELTVSVTVDDQGIPRDVTITGALSPKERQQLQSTIALDLGIPKERQKWIPSS